MTGQFNNKGGTKAMGLSIPGIKKFFSVTFLFILRSELTPEMMHLTIFRGVIDILPRKWIFRDVYSKQKSMRTFLVLDSIL